MAISRVVMSRDLVPGARMVPVVLIAGVPCVFTPAGVRPTHARVTGTTADPLFWPLDGYTSASLIQSLPGGASFDPVQDLLDPDETYEIFERANPLQGDVRVEAFTFSLVDPDNRATAIVSVREARTCQLLAADISESATTIPLASSEGFGLYGIVAIGRETLVFDGKSGPNLLSAVRGKYGSNARAHNAPDEHRPLVAAGGHRHLQSRMCSVWLCTLSEDGAYLGDPLLLFLGLVGGGGVQLTQDLTRWSVPVDHATEALDRKIDLPPLDLSGWAHFSLDASHPLALQAFGLDLSMRDETTGPSNGGWHPSAEAFVNDANRYAFALDPNIRVSLTTDGRIRILYTATTTAGVDACWYDGARWTNEPVTSGRAFETNAAPEACFHMEGWLRVPVATDFARIPSTFAWTATTPGGVVGTASLAIIADTDNTEHLFSEIVERDAARQAVRLAASLPVRLGLSAVDLFKATRCTKRTQAKLGVIAKGDSPVAALMAAALALDALTGQDGLYLNAIDYEHLEQQFNEAFDGFPPHREYRLASEDDTFLSLLVGEFRLRGMTMVIRYGRITGVRLRTVADSETVVAEIAEGYDLLTDDAGVELPTEIIDNDEDLSSTMRFLVPWKPGKPRTVTVTDTTYQSEFGDGTTIEVKAALNVPATVDVDGLDGSLRRVAVQVLSVLSEPNRVVRLQVSPALLDLQPGELVRFTHSRVPTWAGGRGVNGVVCMVQEVRRVLFSRKLHGTVALRLQSGRRYGYAPEAFVAAGGLSSASAVVTFDVAGAWGANGFAQDTNAAGATVTDPLAGFAVGYAVRLCHWSRTPVTSESFTVVAVDTAAHTITLSAPPSVAMAGAASGQYGVSLRFGTYSQCTAEQLLLWAFIADEATTLLDATDPANLWS